MKVSLILLSVLGLASANILAGSYRKRFKPGPVTYADTPEGRSLRPSPVYNRVPTDPVPPPPPAVNKPLPDPVPPVGPPPQPCCQPIFEKVPTDSGSGSDLPMNFPRPAKPNIYYQAIDYQVYDRFHGKHLELFDPEAWVQAYPGVPFPAALDIPRNWYIYSAVTVQAPKPYVDERALREREYIGFYYACPQHVDPYKYSWIWKNEPINPCKWTFYITPFGPGFGAAATDAVQYAGQGSFYQ